jgi:hypothetical protein
VTFSALQNLEIASLVQPREAGAEAVERGVTEGPPLAIVFTLEPQDALVLKHLKDIAGAVDIVLRAPGVEERFETQPVHMDYLIDRYDLHIPIWP